MTVAADMPIDELRLRRFARLAAPLLRGNAVQGIGPRAARNRAGSGLEFLDLRHYTAGEDVRHIDWRQSARRRQLLVRRYRDEAASDWLLAVDGSASMGRGEKWALTLQLATALAYTLIYAGHRVSLAIFSDRIAAFSPAGRGRRQFATLLRELMTFQPATSGGASLPGLCAGKATRSGNVVLLSDFLRPDAMLDDLRQLRGSVAAASAIQILGDRDATANTRGAAILFDLESGAEQRIEITDASNARAADALEQYVRKLRGACASLDVPLSTSRVGDSWDKALLTHFGA